MPIDTAPSKKFMDRMNMSMGSSKKTKMDKKDKNKKSGSKLMQTMMKK